MNGRTVPTTQMIADAAARALANGHDLKTWTAHRIAHDLMQYDADFEGCDYTRLVSVAQLWKRGLSS
ncbi:hypothetical protein ACMA5K_24290 [Bradyrhizobium diazoefficiens]|uniref:hypothetical protein n=1 Tax=Bradyrhizobium diazoefficiens TaxID=1355477 RepID=UPI000BEA0141|nr:hypothetical protein [Bradyrhizobium diazoefficiens]PDT58693.1 hypothetical protein CO678_26030 [Bradyrhizobium diazoefficiens]QLD43862.1 hypothetical protein HUW42_24070 [Bradyrhizobium diazoefficiens]